VTIVRANSPHAAEVESGRRFEFGKNWQAFLRSVDEDRIERAKESLKEMLGCSSLDGKAFIDAGSGSGLFSLAARRLGATVYSFDFDPASVACTAELRRRYFPEDKAWTVVEGSVIDEEFVRNLEEADVVYSWGVLHHTGAMWRGLELLESRVRPGGQLFIALYNDQGFTSRAWTKVKQLYCRSVLGRLIVLGVFVPPLFFAAAAKAISKREAIGRTRGYRGMSLLRDWIDWLGGYPFEVAKPEEVLEFVAHNGLRLEKLKTTNRLGCNEFVFRRVEPVAHITASEK
jgi:2-polyprenyl-6-hydroxyphenyl methylase/3-demethylubiquinone-9 3-methyltransferase